MEAAGPREGFGVSGVQDLGSSTVLARDGFGFRR